MSSIYEKIINYLLENPGSKPRQIADNIGESLTRIRRALYVLRDRGIIARSGQGYVVVKSRLRKTLENSNERIDQNEKPRNGMELRYQTNVYKYEELSKDSRWLSEIITNMLKTMNELNKKISNIEKEIGIIKARVESLEKNKNKKTDHFILMIRQKKIMTIEEAKQYMQKTLEYYVANEYIVIIGNIIVDKEYYEEFKKKFPLSVSEAKKLDASSLFLLKKLIEEGVIYLYGGNEYRFVE